MPLIIIQHNDGQKFLKSNVEPDHVSAWLKDYKVIILFISYLFPFCLANFTVLGKYCFC